MCGGSLSLKYSNPSFNINKLKGIVLEVLTKLNLAITLSTFSLLKDNDILLPAVPVESSIAFIAFAVNAEKPLSRIEVYVPILKVFIIVCISPSDPTGLILPSF